MGNSMPGRTRIGWLMAMVVLAVAASSCGGPGAVVVEAVTCRGVDGDYRPVEVTATFAPPATFYC